MICRLWFNHFTFLYWFTLAKWILSSLNDINIMYGPKWVIVYELMENIGIYFPNIETMQEIKTKSMA